MPRANATRILIFILFVTTILFGYNYFFQPFASDEGQIAVEPTPTPVETPKPEVDVAQLITTMSPEQKVAQLMAMPIGMVELIDPNLSADSGTEATTAQQSPTDSASDSAWLLPTNQTESVPEPASEIPASADLQEKSLADLKPGFMTIFGENLPADRTQSMIRTLREVASLTLPQNEQPMTIKIAVAVDHEGGSVQRLSGTGFTIMPSWQEMCGQEQASRAAIVRQSSLELKSAGIDIVFAPVLDSAVNNVVLGDRICGADPATVSAIASEFATLFDFVEITPVVKHFPGIGQTTRDLHFGYQSINPDQAELNIFRHVMDSFPEIGIMSTFVGVNTQDPSKPCALSEDCVGQLVSEYPEALLFTDALEMVSAGTHGASASAVLTKRSELAIRAGNHVLVYGEAVDEDEFAGIISDLTEIYQADADFASLVDQRLEQVLKYKLRQGLL